MQFWSVGKPHEAYAKPGIEEFTKRLNNYFSTDWLLIAPPKNAGNLSETELKKAEGLLLLAQLQKEDYLILLDERGKLFSSPSWHNGCSSGPMKVQNELFF